MPQTTTYQAVSVLKVLLNAIAYRPLSQYEIIEKTGLCNSTVSRWLRFLNASSKDTKNLVYIAEWKKGKAGNPTALWMMGFDMPNAPRPKPLTAAQYCKNWRIKKETQAEIQRTEKGLIYVAK